MSAQQKDTIAYISKWLIGILITATGFVLSTSYVSMTQEIKDQGKMMQDINARLIRVETKLESK